MSSNERRKKVDREKAVSSQSQRGIRSNLPRTNLANSVTRSQNRIRNIKSPFATDQTKTIGNRPSQTKKRSVGQIPLRDRQHSNLKVNQKQSSGLGSSGRVRPLPQKKVQQQRKQIKKVQKQVRKPNQFNKKNKSRSDVEQVFNFDADNRSFF